MTAEIRVLGEDDDRSGFTSGDEALDVYFRRYAGQNPFRHHVGVTYVAVEGSTILGFLTVSTASLDADALPDGRPRPPYPLPVLRVARLATDARARGLGVGRGLLRFTLELAERQRDEVGCVGVLVDAKPEAVEFYERYGFVMLEALAGAAPIHPAPTAMYLPLGSVPRVRNQVHFHAPAFPPEDPP